MEFRVHSPFSPRKSGIPDSVEIPAPVKPTIRDAPATRSRALLSFMHASLHGRPKRRSIESFVSKCQYRNNRGRQNGRWLTAPWEPAGGGWLALARPVSTVGADRGERREVRASRPSVGSVRRGAATFRVGCAFSHGRRPRQRHVAPREGHESRVPARELFDRRGRRAAHARRTRDDRPIVDVVHEGSRHGQRVAEPEAPFRRAGLVAVSKRWPNRHRRGRRPGLRHPPARPAGRPAAGPAGAGGPAVASSPAGPAYGSTKTWPMAQGCSSQ